MQRIYDVPRKKKMDTAEFFELRENTQQEQQQFEMKPPASYKIPSSSNLMSSSGGNRTYKPASMAYDDGKDKDRPPQQQTPYVSPRSIHCVVIADHIMDCPICSRFYRNYTPFYNVVFLILLTILIFLFIRCQKLSFVAAKHLVALPSSS